MSDINFLRETIELARTINTRDFELGQRLYLIREEEKWKADEDCGSFYDFLSLAGIHSSKASILMSVYKHYVVEGGIDQNKLALAPYSSLYEAIPLLETRKHADVVQMAMSLTRDEIKAESRELKHGECEHPETFTICGKCKKRTS